MALTLSVDGNIYIIDCVDPAESRHTVDYLVIIVEFNAEKVKEKFGCTVRSFVTDTAANMADIKKDLGKGEEIITYGCSANLLNLLSQDMQIRNIKKSYHINNKVLPESSYPWITV